MIKKIACMAVIAMITVWSINSRTAQSQSSLPGLTSAEMATQVGACCGVGTLVQASCAHAKTICVQLWVNVGPVPVPQGCVNGSWDTGCNNENGVLANGKGASTINGTVAQMDSKSFTVKSNRHAKSFWRN